MFCVLNCYAGLVAEGAVDGLCRNLGLFAAARPRMKGSSRELPSKLAVVETNNTTSPLNTLNGMVPRSPVGRPLTTHRDQTVKTKVSPLPRCWGWVETSLSLPDQGAIPPRDVSWFG